MIPIAALLVALAHEPAYAFPLVPIRDQIEIGARTARAGKGLERLYMENRRVVGTWFDGRVQVPIEQVVWVNARLVGRWLGYLQEREGWPSGELLDRWLSLRRHLEGRLAFLIQVAAFPRADFLDLTPYTPAHPELPEPIRAVLHVGSARFEAPVEEMTTWKAYDRAKFRHYRWWLDTPIGRELAPEFEREPFDAGYPIGNYAMRWLWCEIETPPALFWARRFQLRLVSRSKVRLASFPAFPERMAARLGATSEPRPLGDPWPPQ